ncbi:MAG: hypothetical protein SAJ12_05935 [Jaaginema sp. PMC 1079.18]|nr:hypothetical protein [Jaaginema sp. PMC 1080.18]MEC4850531.1 hypothetical protein [Jaaginema sp. PMC 1079.18]MEC4865787.1 hypothetical protein [Jaaginema sp. PMC 1078.18]
MLVRTQIHNNCLRATADCTQNTLSSLRLLDSNEPSFFTTNTMLTWEHPLINFASFDSEVLPIDESYIELTVAVCQAQTLSSLRSLKDFLTVLANPVSIEKVLLQGIYLLAETHPLACRWLLSDPNYLMPELDFIDLTQQFVLASLQKNHIAEAQIAVLENNDLLTPKASLQQQNLLWQNVLSWMLHQSLCPGDRLLIEATLDFLQNNTQDAADG